MRQIKFRAWLKDDREMVGVDCIDFQAGVICHKSISSRSNKNSDGEIIEDSTTELKDIILQQFTSLKDKNGKEIYEGDIVIVRRWVEMKLRGVGENDNPVLRSDDSCLVIGEIVFDPEKGYFIKRHLPKKGSNVFKDFDWEEDTEKIGNIYENPELLNE